MTPTDKAIESFKKLLTDDPSIPPTLKEALLKVCQDPKLDVRPVAEWVSK